jgi:hypothetical protein
MTGTIENAGAAIDTPAAPEPFNRSRLGTSRWVSTALEIAVALGDPGSAPARQGWNVVAWGIERAPEDELAGDEDADELLVHLSRYGLYMDEGVYPPIHRGRYNLAMPDAPRVDQVIRDICVEKRWPVLSRDEFEYLRDRADKKSQAHDASFWAHMEKKFGFPVAAAPEAET